MPEEVKQYKRSIGLVTADVEENCIDHGNRGILTHENIEKMIGEYDEEDKQARIHGKFQHLVGLVFKKFDRAIHLVKPFEINTKDFCVYEALDPHPRNEDATLWVAVNRQGTCFAFNEIYANLPTEELAGRIMSFRQNYRIVSEIIDPMAFTVDQHTGRSLRGDIYLASNGMLAYKEGSKRRFDAVRKIKDCLNYQKKGNEMLVAPTLYIFDTCLRLIWEIEHWQWQEWYGKAKERKSPPDKPEDRNDHMIENLGRILLEDPTFEEYYYKEDTYKQPETDPYE